jgi:hypothetical protein
MILDRLIFESDAILFIGYGFQDDHLNNAFEFIRYDWNKIRKVAVVDYSDNSTASLCGGRHDDWTMGLSKTIPFDSINMGDGTKSLRRKHPTVAGYMQSCSVEKSSDSSHPLAIWYNGFTEACNHPHVILNELL